MQSSVQMGNGVMQIQALAGQHRLLTRLWVSSFSMSHQERPSSWAFQTMAQSVYLVRQVFRRLRVVLALGSSSLHHKSISIATFLAPNVYPAYQFIGDYIGRGLGLPVEILFIDSHDRYFDINADFSFICGLPYIQFKQDHPTALELIAAPVLIGERYQDKPIYFSDVIVSKDSDYQRFKDLRGKRWGYNETISQSGYGITRHHLINMQETNGFFGKVIHAHSHQNTIQLVVDGKLDAGAIDTQVLEVEFMQHPHLEDQLRIIETFGPSPIQPIVANSQLPTSLKQDVQAVLLAIGDDETAKPMLAQGLFKRFVSVTDSDYDPIRDMVSEARATDFMKLR